MSDAPSPGLPGADEPREPQHAKVTTTGRSARNMQTLAGVIMLALILVAVIVIVAGGKDEPAPPPRSDTTEFPGGVAETTAMLKGIPQTDATLGSPQAPVTILEIADLQCPHCRDHQLAVQPQLIDRLVRTGQARIQLVSIGMLGEDSEVLRNVHERLSAKGKGWEFATLALFNQGLPNSGYASDEFLQRIVASIPGTTPADADRGGETAVARRVKATRKLVNAHVAQLADPNQFGTPAFAVGPTGADPATFKPVALTGDEPVLDQLIAAVRRQSERRGVS